MMNQFYDTKRTIESYWVSSQWLGNRMLFLSGPRQVGKTTLITNKLVKEKEAYFNWDHRPVRSQFQKNPDFFASSSSKWIYFDEIHKRPRWKDILKGIYDSHKDRFRFVVSGSARLETFKKSGDSLVGRYFHTHLFPLNLADFNKKDFSFPKNPVQLALEAGSLKDAKNLDDLLVLGGFPEPFYSGSQEFRDRWSLQHRDLIIHEDLRDLSRIIDLDRTEHLMDMLNKTTGNPVSNRNFALDLETTHGSVKRWLKALSLVHLVFPVPSYSKKISRAYRSEKKWYFIDWSAASTNRFENFVGSSLMRAAQLYEDRFGKKMSLYFVRTHDGTEVDFLLCLNGKPWLLVEAKEGTPQPTHAVYRFSEELNVPAFIVTRQPNIFKEIKDKTKQRIFCISWAKLGQLLP